MMIGSNDNLSAYLLFLVSLIRKSNKKGEDFWLDSHQHVSEIANYLLEIAGY